MVRRECGGAQGARAAWMLVAFLAGSAVGCHRAEPSRDPASPAVAEVTRRLGSQRFTLPWLSAFGEYVPCAAAQSSSPSSANGYCGPLALPPLPPLPSPSAAAPPPALRGAAAAAPAVNTEADELHADGLQDLRLGDLDGAITRLERSRDHAPGDWRVRNDLGSAYLVRALADGGTDRLAALEELDRAVAAGPERLPARFNHALALEELRLPAAEGAWQAVLDLDPPPGWSAEAEAGLASARASARETDPDRLVADLREALATGRPEIVQRRVRASPQDALRFAETELLGGWSRAVAAGDEATAEARLAEADLLGRAVEAVTGDAFVAATVAEAAGLPRFLQAELAAAVGDYLAGREAYGARELAVAEDRLDRARETAGPFGAPLRLWIDYHLALCEYWKGAPEARDHFLALEREIEGQHLPVLAGYLSWMNGLTAVEAGRFTAGYRELTRALDGFEALGLRDAAGTVRILRSDELVRLGQVPAAWDEIWQAVSHARDFRDPRHLAAAWDQAAHVASALGYLHAAPYLHTEALRAARRAKSPLTPATAAVASAEAWNRLGKRSAARRDLVEARSWARRIQDASVRTRSEAYILAAEARATEPGQEPEAISRLSGAIRRYRAIDQAVLLADLLLERARLELQVGRFPEGEDDLRQALELKEVERRSIADVEWRVSFSDTTRPVLDLLIRHRLETAGAAETIPALTDLARDPAYFAPLAPDDTRTLLTTGFERGLDLRPGEALLSATLLDDRLVLWVSRAGKLFVATSPLSGEVAARRLAAIGRAPSRDDLEWLYDRMIRPVDRRLEGVDRLFVALDRGLRGLPIAALRDRDTGQPLVRRFAIAQVPAAIVLAHADALHRPVPTERLAVAGAASAPGMSPLPQVAAEVASLRRLYAGSEELASLGSAADLETAGARADVLHFAGHAVSNPLMPSLSHLVFGPRSVYAKEIRKLRLTRARTVVLASCETVVSDPRDSSGALSLAVAFLEAGANWVVASVWPVEDRAARRFSERFHQELRRGASPDRALRSTQLWLLDQDPGLDLRDWAGFQAIAR